MTLPRPVFVGDTISATADVVTTRRLESREDAGLVELESRTTNQQDQPVLETDLRFLVRRKNSCDSPTDMDQQAQDGTDG
jgi:acyl dehydratase